MVASVEEIGRELRAGHMVVVCDDERGTGVLAAAAEHASADVLTFMAVHGRGLICLTLTGERCEALALQPMAGACSMVSIEAREGVTTGISAADRARTIAVAVDPASTARDLVAPGHVFPLRTRAGGVLEVADVAHASVDLARLAGLRPTAVKCEVLDEDGAVADPAQLLAFSVRHGLKLITLSRLVAHRLRHDRAVVRVGTIRRGRVREVHYRCAEDRRHVALVDGAVSRTADVCVRVEAERVSGAGGVVLRLAGATPADYAIGAQILIDLGVTSARILTNDPRRTSTMSTYLLLANHSVSIQPAPALTTAA